MKLTHIFLIFFCILSVYAQRQRTPVKPEGSETVEQVAKPRGRGRTRFTATSEFAEASEEKTESNKHKSASRRRPNTRPHNAASVDQSSPSSLINNYEVQEIIDDAPIETLRRPNGKTRTITETHFEAQNAPRTVLNEPTSTSTPPLKRQPPYEPATNAQKRPLFEPSPVIPAGAIKLDPDELLRSIGTFELPTIKNIDTENLPDLEESSPEFSKPATDKTTISSENPKIENEIRRTQEITTPKPLDAGRRMSAFRRNLSRARPSNIQQDDATTTQASVRQNRRTRPTRKPEEVNAPASAPTAQRTPITRGSRRRLEAASTSAPETRISRSRGPSVLVAEEAQQLPSRSRTGRRIDPNSHKRIEDTSAPEKLTLDLNARTSSSTRKNTNRKISETDSKPFKLSERSKKRLSSRYSAARMMPTESTSEIRTTRGKARATDIPVSFDEQNLEVLPLFETEAKLVSTGVDDKYSAKRRSYNSNEESVQMSATENDVKVSLRPATTSETTTTPSNTIVTRKQSVSVEPPSFRRKSDYKKVKPQIKESVVSEITEITSKRTVVNRRKLPNKIGEDSGAKTVQRVKIDEPKITVSQVVTSSRGTKRSKPNLSEVKSGKKGGSEEEIDEGDNYPEEFKAILQAKKKQKEESRSRVESPGNVVTTKRTTTERVTIVTPSVTSPSTTSSYTTTTTTTQPFVRSSTTSSKDVEEIDNEVDPKQSTTTGRPSRRRLPAKITTKPEISRGTTKKSTKFIRSTTNSPPAVVSKKDHRFHARFTSEKPDVETVTTPSSISGKSGRTFNPKSRGIYSSSRKYKETNVKTGKNENLHPTQIPSSASAPSGSGIKKPSSRFSSRYRSDRASSVRTTAAPHYLPTIPTVTPSPGRRIEDKELGLEIISFDDPVNTIPSAALVNGEYLSSTVKTHPSLSTTPVSTTEKAVSIIERIINSITAINATTTTQEAITKDSATERSTDSAILKLATKKPTKTDKLQQQKTQQDKTTLSPSNNQIEQTTSQKPTTIIQRILSSLSEIQANDTSKKVGSKSYQVGANFNTISSEHTTPLSRVTKAAVISTSLPAQISTSVNPLIVLDELSEDQVIQKRTIGKLLNLLNSLVSTTQAPQTDKYVVVTPKVPKFHAQYSTNTPTTTTTNTEAPTTQQLFTSVQTEGSVDLSARILPESTTTVLPTTITTTVQTTNITPDTTTTQASTQTSTDSTTIPPVPNALSILSSSPSPNSETTQTQIITDSNKSTTLDITNGVEVLPLFLDSSVTSLLTEPTSPGTPAVLTDSTTPSSQNPDLSSTLSFSTSPVSESVVTDSTTPSLLSSTDSVPPSTVLPTGGTDSTETIFTYPSTIPTIANFEVSPGSVSVFNANDLSNILTQDEGLLSTVTISGRGNFPDSTTTIESSTVPFTTPSSNVVDINTISTISPNSTVDNNTLGSTTTSQDSSTTPSVDANALSNNIDGSTTEMNQNQDSTTQINADSTTQITTDSSTSPNVSDSSTTVASSTEQTTENMAFTSPPINTTDATNTSSTTNGTSSNTNSSSTFSNRDGRILAVEQEPVQNSIETSSMTPEKDYYIFAVLPNNTILRKRPSRYPNRETPYLLVGILPNNTIVRKFPNGTEVPMEPVIRVRGFDTRENPPPLLEITDNQVTTSSDQGNSPSPPDNQPSLRTVDSTQNSIDANALSLGGTSDNNITQSGTTKTTTNAPVSSSNSPTPSTTTISSKNSSQPPSGNVVDNTISDSTGSTSTTSAPQPPSTTTTEMPSPLISSLAGILNGKTVQAYNNLVNRTEEVKTLQVDPKTNQVVNFDKVDNAEENVIYRWKPVTGRNFIDVLNINNLDNLNTFKHQATTTNGPPTATTPPVVFETPSTLGLTTTTTEQKAPTTTQAPPPPTTTTSRKVQSTTFTPSFFSTIISTLQPILSTFPPTTLTTEEVSTVTPFTTPIAIKSTTTKRSVSSTTSPPATTMRRKITNNILDILTRGNSGLVDFNTASTTQVPVIATTPVTTTKSPIDIILPVSRGVSSSTKRSVPKKKELTEEQRKNLETLAQLEKEQAAILKQLSFLTNLNLGGANPAPAARPKDNNNLANRIIALAMERDQSRSKSTTTAPVTESLLDSLTSRTPKKLSNPTLEDVLKQYNIQGLEEVTAKNLQTTYGTSNDALLAALLKEQGIGPTTPKSLGDQIKEAGLFEQTTKRAKPKRPRTTTTTERPAGRLIQGLNWLLTALAPPPPPVARPRPKPKAKKTTTTTESSAETELLANQPTHLSPVVEAAPSGKQSTGRKTALSQEEISRLIKQLESIQNDPKNAINLDVKSVKNLQNFISKNGGVEVITPSSKRKPSRSSTRAPKGIQLDEDDEIEASTPKPRGRKSTTVSPKFVSNSIADDELDEPTTPKPRSSLPPVRLRPVAGVDNGDGEPMVRGQLITAAVNVTRAISQFLGSAIQDAAEQVSRMISTGSGGIRNLFSASSLAGSSAPSG